MLLMRYFASSVHLVKQPSRDRAASNYQAELHIQLKLNSISLHCAAASDFYCECLSQGIAKQVEIKKATITHRLEFSGPQKQLEKRWCEALR